MSCGVSVVAYPNMMPACMLLIVSFAMIVLGLLSSTRGSLEALSKSASLEMAMPGVIAWEQLADRRHLVQNYVQSLEVGGDRDGEFVVPAGQYLVMGDNRDNSDDGRYWGMLPEANLRGKAFLVWMNFDWSADRKVDVSRIGSKIP